jgi:hypothetical protein
VISYRAAENAVLSYCPATGRMVLLQNNGEHFL